MPRHAEDGIWLAPIQDRSRGAAGRGRGGRRGLLGITLDQYLTLVDRTGRLVAAGTGAVIPAELRPILARLGLDGDRWTGAMSRTGRLFGTAIGSAASLAEEAARRGRRWIVAALDVCPPTAPA